MSDRGRRQHNVTALWMLGKWCALPSTEAPFTGVVVFSVLESKKQFLLNIGSSIVPTLADLGGMP